MDKITAVNPEAQSADLVSANIEQLKALFPELITEGANGAAVNLDVLKELIGDHSVTDADEKYGLNWHGKRRARQLALTPSMGTLRPCPGESVDWATTQNLMIEGDNLEVLKLLQKSYAGKVKLIYIDPPYNTGKDFVYPDNYQDNIRNYLELTGQAEGGKRISSNTEASGRFHTDWLTMMYPRLKLAHSMLRRDGVIFISIDDGELSHLRMLCDEIFGEENFIANIVWQKKQSPQNDAINLSDMHDHIVVYAKRALNSKSDNDGWKANRITRGDTQESRYDNKDDDLRGDWTSADLTCNKTSEERPNLYYPVLNPVTKEEVWPSKTRVWGYEKPVMDKLLQDRRIWWGRNGENRPRLKIFRSEVDNGVVPSTWWDRKFAGDNQDAKREIRSLFDSEEVFDTPKPTSLIRRIIEISTLSTEKDIVMDFFAGSGTTGHAVLEANALDQGNRRFILIQIPEPIKKSRLGFSHLSDVTRERLRRASAKIQSSDSLFSGDSGFRAFKLEQSNIRAWNPSPTDLAASLFDHQDHLLEGRSEADVLYELLLKLGLDLCVPIQQRTIASREVHAVGGGVLVACLAEKITREQVEALAQGIIDWHKELAPAGDTTCVFRDSAFEDDVAKTNLAAILEQHGIQNVRSL